MKTAWSTAEHRYVLANLHRTDAEIAAALGRSAASVKRYRLRTGIEKGQERGWMNYKSNFKQYRTAA